MVRLRKDVFDRGRAVPVGRGFLYSREWFRYRYNDDDQFQIIYDRKWHDADPDHFEFEEDLTGVQD